MAYPMTPTEFPTKPTGSVSKPERLRLVTEGFTAETSVTGVGSGLLTIVTKGPGGVG